jgi:hypothetical protein
MVLVVQKRRDSNLFEPATKPRLVRTHIHTRTHTKTQIAGCIRDRCRCRGRPLSDTGVESRECPRPSRDASFFGLDQVSWYQPTQVIGYRVANKAIAGEPASDKAYEARFIYMPRCLENFTAARPAALPTLAEGVRQPRRARDSGSTRRRCWPRRPARHSGNRLDAQGTWQ